MILLKHCSDCVMYMLRPSNGALSHKSTRSSPYTGPQGPRGVPFVTFLTMYLNTSLPSPLCLPPCCSSDGPEVVGHRSRAHQDNEWAGQPIALRKSNLAGGAQFFWGQMENNNRGHLEQAWGLSTSPCLSKAWTAERAILKGGDEHANLL